MTDPDETARPRGPLSGVRVVDLSTVLLGPYATQILGDLGAEVIKVESPEGDMLRYGGPPARHRDMGPIFIQVNRNKRSIVLDLKTRGGAAILRRLLSRADLFLTNVRPKGLARLGFDYEAVAAVKPDIVYVSCVGFATNGPYGERQAFDDLIQAASGAASLMSRVDGDPEPRFIPSLVADKTTGLHAVYAALAALFHRARTGEGQHVEVPMLESFTSFLLAEHLYGRSFDPPTGPSGYTRVLNPNRKPFPTRDGHIFIMPYSDGQWATFFALGGRPGLMDDPRFSDFAERTRNIATLYGLIREVAATKTSAEWLDLLDKADIPAMRVNDLDAVAGDPHVAATGFLARREHPTEGAYVTPRPPVAFSRTPGGIGRDAPRLGADGPAIAAEAGFSAEEIAALARDGAFGPQGIAAATTPPRSGDPS